MGGGGESSGWGIREVKSRKKNLAVAWIHHKKTYDMVLSLWIKECLDFFGVAQNIKILLVNSMEKWRAMLCKEFRVRRS